MSEPLEPGPDHFTIGQPYGIDEAPGLTLLYYVGDLNAAGEVVNSRQVTRQEYETRTLRPAD
jgi:hypothetical protein